MFDILKDERGISVTIFTMFIAVLMMVLIYTSVDFSKTVQDHDVNLQIGVEEAVRNASFMVMKDSLALGKPILDHQKAHEAFLRILEKRIHHGEIVNYIFVVYNHGYGNTGEVYKYNKDIAGFSNYSTFSEEEHQFFVSVDDINLTDGEVSTTLDRPGCIALVELKTSDYAKSKEETGFRWAVSSLELEKDFY